MKQSILTALVAVAGVQLCTASWSSPAAAAESRPAFKECFGATIVDVEAASTGKVVPPEKATQLPAGWTLAGGAAKGPAGFVVLCR